jgi:hypothetical protein
VGRLNALFKIDREMVHRLSPAVDVVAAFLRVANRQQDQLARGLIAEEGSFRLDDLADTAVGGLDGKGVRIFV